MSPDQLAALVKVAESTRDGDPALVEALLDCLTDDGTRFACRGCGQRFQWPGQRDAHACRRLIDLEGGDDD